MATTTDDGPAGSTAATAVDRIRVATGSCQPPVHALAAPVVLCAVLGSLAIGGAERIVVDWATRHRSRYRVRLFVIHRQGLEWPVPNGIEVVRPGLGQPVAEALKDFAAHAAAAWRVAFGHGTPVVLCHMSHQAHRDALEAGGASAVPVLHNAREGWREPFEALRRDRRLIAVSQACVDDLTKLGRRDAVSLIRHIPSIGADGDRASDAARASMRAAVCRTLGLPEREPIRLIAMLGAIKAQKNYARALEILHLLSADPVATFLVIFGGPVGRDGRQRWDELCAGVRRLNLQDRVRLPGFVPEAARWLPAFDLLLNTSDFEGLSIATLEALQARVPVVASLVGGQGELRSPGLTLVPAHAAAASWATAIRRVGASPRPARPTWAGFPSHRLWTLEHLSAAVKPRRHVLFVTANLNAGGAQRSLVNLASQFAREGSAAFTFEVAVTGESSGDWFHQSLLASGVPVERTAQGRDCFDHAEGLAQWVARSRTGIVCFWNVDPKIKLLTAKTAPSRVHLVDVSPGGYAFEEMQATGEFQQLIGFDQAQYYARLSRLVLKYDSPVPADVGCPTSVVRNGVPRPASRSVSASRPRVIVNGRIAPTKFLIEIVEAMQRVWTRQPEIELHLIGCAEPRHESYAQQLFAALATHWEAGRRIHLHGARYELAEVASERDIGVVLGHHQGCPNAALEALALGMAVVANDSGGTAEVVRHGHTGLLIQGHAGATVATAIERLLADPVERQRLGEAGRDHVQRNFSMAAMALGYLQTFEQLVSRETTCA